MTENITRLKEISKEIEERCILPLESKKQVSESLEKVCNMVLLRKIDKIEIVNTIQQIIKNINCS